MLKPRFKCLFISMLLSTATMAADNPYWWSGAYIGAHLGNMWVNHQLNANDINFLNDSAGVYNQNLNNTSVAPGLQAGYLKAFKQTWLIGVEGDVTYPNTHAHFSSINLMDGAFDAFNVSNHVQGSLRLRTGYAINRLLPFVTGGTGFSDMTINYRNEVGNDDSTHTTQIGVVVGGGLEYSLPGKLSARLEFLYTDYGNAANMKLPDVDTINTAGNVSADLYTSLLRAALNYRF